MLRHILRKGPPVTITHAHTHHRGQQARHLIGNPDLAVLRTENQTTTHVTPRIDMYATGFFREALMVIGPPPVHPRKPSPAEEQEIRGRLHRLLAKASDDRRPNIEIRPNKRLKARSVWLSEIQINGENYHVGIQLRSSRYQSKYLLGERCCHCPNRTKRQPNSSQITQQPSCHS